MRGMKITAFLMTFIMLVSACEVVLANGDITIPINKETVLVSESNAPKTPYIYADLGRTDYIRYGTNGYATIVTPEVEAGIYKLTLNTYCNYYHSYRISVNGEIVLQSVSHNPGTKDAQNIPVFKEEYIGMINLKSGVNKIKIEVQFDYLNGEVRLQSMLLEKSLSTEIADNGLHLVMCNDFYENGSVATYATDGAGVKLTPEDNNPATFTMDVCVKKSGVYSFGTYLFTPNKQAASRWHLDVTARSGTKSITLANQDVSCIYTAYSENNRAAPIVEGYGGVYLEEGNYSLEFSLSKVDEYSVGYVRIPHFILKQSDVSMISEGVYGTDYVSKTGDVSNGSDNVVIGINGTCDYNIYVEESGYYNCNIETSTPDDTVPKIQFEKNGEVYLNGRVVATGGLDKFSVNQCGGIWLDKGINTIKLKACTQIIGLRKMNFVKNISLLIPAAGYIDYEMSESYYNTAYSSNSHAKTEDKIMLSKTLSNVVLCEDEGIKGSCTYQVYTKAGDYQFIINKAGNYAGYVTVLLDGKEVEQSETLNTLSIGNSSTFEDVNKFSLYDVSEGIHTIKIVAKTGEFNLKEIRLKPSSPIINMYFSSDIDGKNEITSFEVGTVYAYIDIENNCDFDGGYTAVVVKYLDNRMDDYIVQDLPVSVGENKSFTIPLKDVNTGNTIKIMLFDNMKNIEPVACAEMKKYQQTTLYVSPDGFDDNDGRTPFKTIEGVKNYIRTINSNMTGDIVVNIANGEYELGSRLNFETADSGTNGFDIIYRAVEGANPIISGGKKVKGWSKSNITNVWQAPVDSISVRQLYVDGKRATRARSSEFTVVDIMSDNVLRGVTKSGKVDNITLSDIDCNSTNLELVRNIEWSHQRFKVNSITKRFDFSLTPKYDINFEQTYSPNMIKQGNPNYIATNGRYCYLENAMEFMDEEDEWYYDTDKNLLFYYTTSNPNEKEIYIPKAEGLMDIVGTSSGERVENIVFDGITFVYGGWSEPDIYGFFSWQSDALLDPTYTPTGTERIIKMLPAQITIKNAKNIRICNSVIKHQGSGGIALEEFVTDCKIDNNTFTDLSAYAIRVGGDNYNAGNNTNMCKKTSIEYNKIDDISKEYFSSPGIGVYYAIATKVLHNTIMNVPYCGLQFAWGFDVSPLLCKDNKIAYNYIDDTMKLMVDGAPLYFVGTLRNSHIYNNYIGKSGHFRGGIYIDHGTTYGNFYNNVIVGGKLYQDKKYWLYDWDGSEYCSKYNTFSNNYTDSDDYLLNGENIVEGTIVQSTWSTEAQAIINSAGCGK